MSKIGIPLTHMDVSENSGTPKSSILVGFSIINHPFWGTPIFGNSHISISALKFTIKNISRMGTSSGSMLGLRIFSKRRPAFFLPHGFGVKQQVANFKNLTLGSSRHELPRRKTALIGSLTKIRWIPFKFPGFRVNKQISVLQYISMIHPIVWVIRFRDFPFLISFHPYDHGQKNTSKDNPEQRPVFVFTA